MHTHFHFTQSERTRDEARAQTQDPRMALAQQRNDNELDLKTKLRNAQLSCRRWQCCAFANINEVTRLTSEIAALEARIGRTPSSLPTQAPQQSDRNYMYNRYDGLLAVLKDSATSEDVEQQKLAKRCLNWLQTNLPADTEIEDDSDLSSGLLALSQQLQDYKTSSALECCICYDVITPEDCLVMPECWHIMHASCYLSWARSKAKTNGDAGLFDQHGNEIAEFAGMFPRVGVYECPLGKCKGHDADSWKICMEERQNAIMQRGASGEGSCDPILDGPGFIAMLREKKQLFAISGDTILQNLPASDSNNLTEGQLNELKQVGFYVEARLPGKGGDYGVCNPPCLATYTELSKVNLKDLSPSVAIMSTRDTLGIKGKTFKIENLPADWQWDELPLDCTIRLTSKTAKRDGGTLKMDLSKEFVAQFNDKMESPEDIGSTDESKTHSEQAGRKKKRKAVALSHDSIFDEVDASDAD